MQSWLKQEKYVIVKNSYPYQVIKVNARNNLQASERVYIQWRKKLWKKFIILQELSNNTDNVIIRHSSTSNSNILYFTHKFRYVYFVIY